MNSVSSHLLSFISENLLHKKPQSPFFSVVSRTFISTLFQKIHDANNLWYEKYDQVLTTESEYDYKHYKNYKFIPEEIRKKHIENKPREKIFQRKFSFPIANREFHIHLWFPITLPTNHKKTEILMSHNQIQEKIIFILRKVYIWLQLVSSYLPKTQKCSQNVDIYLFLTEHKKNLPSHMDIHIDEIHANTAFTTGCTTEHTTISVFREEEWFKVFMHETFHNLGLDFIDIDHPRINDVIRNIFPIPITDIRVYEVYAEMWAEIMNTLFLVYEMDSPARKGRLPMVRWIATAEKAFILEQTFSLFQANKILYFQKMKYPDLFNVSLASNYKENTYIFSYFILKSIWMIHVNEFLEFCAKQTGKFTMKFDLSSKNLDRFLTHLVDFARSDKYISEISRIHALSIPILDKKKKGDFIANTLRMTCLELL